MPLQLLNGGEKPDVTYAEAVPWLEIASFGGPLVEREVSEVSTSTSHVPSPPPPRNDRRGKRHTGRENSLVEVGILLIKGFGGAV